MVEMRVTIGRLAEVELPEAKRVVQLAFGTFRGVPDPENFWTDRDYVYGRARAPHVAGFGATLDGKLVGSNFAIRWGSVGFFGPLSVRPDLWERGIARQLLAVTMERFASWQTRHVGLFTFGESAKHVGLYQKYGFHARFLTAIMVAPVTKGGPAPSYRRYGALNARDREAALAASRAVTDGLYPGLDLSDEIQTVAAQGLGDTLLLDDDEGLCAFAICHFGPASEAGNETCFIKFAAVRAAGAAAQNYERLIDACLTFAASVGQSHLLAGANMARDEAYRRLVARGFRTQLQGVAMHRDNDPGYCRPGVFIIDDWR